jgi:glycolate oxidase iron-sulfur subunit
MQTSTIKSLGFDDRHPPAADLIDACVHCGFCLSTCPSYRVLGTEADSPRGRIYLMNGINTGEIPLSEVAVEHFDTCLGCLACTTTCPSGVQYDKLIEATRMQVARNHPRSGWEKLYRQFIFNVFPYPDRLKSLLAPLYLYQKMGLQKLVRQTKVVDRLSPQLAAMEANLPALDASAFNNTYPEVVPAVGKKRYRVGMLLGCVQRLFFDSVNRSTLNVLTANGCEVVIPSSQGCCAALPHHQGEEEQAKTMARQTINAFDVPDLDYIIINAAGCGHTLKEYDRILADDKEYRDQAIAFQKKVRDVQEFLIEVGMTATLAPISTEELLLVYQDACHLLHGQKISVQPRQLLKQIPQVRLKEPLDAALCCGSAGVYNLLQPEVARELGMAKAQNLLDTGAKAIVSPNPGCSLQISRYLAEKKATIPVYHPMQLLDLSIRREKLADLSGNP